MRQGLLGTRIYSMKAHFPEIRPSTQAFLSPQSRNQDLRSGLALRRHCDSAHGGVEDVNCPACRELRKKMEALA